MTQQQAESVKDLASKKEIIKQAYIQSKMVPFNQATLFDVFKKSGLKVQTFVDTIWELFKKDEKIYFLSARRRRSIPKRELRIIDRLLERVPKKKRIFFPLARYMSWKNIGEKNEPARCTRSQGLGKGYG